MTESMRYCETCGNPLQFYQKTTCSLKCAGARISKLRMAGYQPRYCEICGKELTRKQKVTCGAFCRVQLDRKRRGLKYEKKPVEEVKEPDVVDIPRDSHPNTFRATTIAGKVQTGMEWLLEDPQIAKKHENFSISPLQGGL